jgi:hypothetical protein
MKWVVLFWTGWDPILLNSMTVVMVDEGRNCKNPIGSAKVLEIKGSIVDMIMEGCIVTCAEPPKSRTVYVKNKLVMIVIKYALMVPVSRCLHSRYSCSRCSHSRHSHLSSSCLSISLYVSCSFLRHVTSTAHEFTLSLDLLMSCHCLSFFSSSPSV